MKSFTDIEQSQILEQFLPLESADMQYIKMSEDDEPDAYRMGVLANPELIDEDDIPCWSLAALLNILPILERKGYQKSKPQLLYNVYINKWIVDSHVYTTDSYDNPVDACVNMILNLHDRKLL